MTTVKVRTERESGQQAGQSTTHSVKQLSLMLMLLFYLILGVKPVRK